jgi:hypothetical protein
MSCARGRAHAAARVRASRGARGEGGDGHSWLARMLGLPAAGLPRLSQPLFPLQPGSLPPAAHAPLLTTCRALRIDPSLLMCPQAPTTATWLPGCGRLWGRRCAPQTSTTR